MIRVTFKIDGKEADYEFDEKQKISDVLMKVYERNRVESKNIKATFLETDIEIAKEELTGGMS